VPVVHRNTPKFAKGTALPCPYKTRGAKADACAADRTGSAPFVMQREDVFQVWKIQEAARLRAGSLGFLLCFFFRDSDIWISP